VIGSTRQVAVYAYGAPVDLRKGFDGLSGLVTQELGRDPLAGDFFVFVNRGRKRAKVLLWDGTGLCIYAKRLERGRFACLWREGTTGPLRLTMSELQLFLEGSALVGRVALSPAPFERATASRAQKILASRARG
jgi:transposase